MTSLADLLGHHRSGVCETLWVGNADWDKLVEEVRKQEMQESETEAFYDEQIWTFLAGCGYAMAGKNGASSLAAQLIGTSPPSIADPRIWFEVSPKPPREREGGTNLDLALGSIGQRGGQKSGIQLDDTKSSWICFCEAKWYSDIAYHTKHDEQRNQLIRVIENALCFQESGRVAEEVYVVLITPKVFQQASVKSRLYHYKYQDYVADYVNILRDLNVCRLERRKEHDWAYPRNIEELASKLTLNWASYEDLFANMPESPILPKLLGFFAQYNKSKERALVT